MSLRFSTYKKSIINSIVAIAFLAVLWYVLVTQFDLVHTWSQLSVSDIDTKYWFLVFVLLLLIPNWGLEAQKWRLAMREYLDIDLRFSLRSVLAGIAVGLFTPAKVGEYAGRMFFLKQEDRAASAVSTFINSMAQLSATILFGSISLMCLVYRLDLVQLNFTKLLIAAAVMLALIIASFSLLPELVSLLSHVKFISRYMDKITDIKVPRQILFSIISLSCLRYAVYAFQYVFVFYFLGVEYCLVELLGFVSIVFLLQTLLPLPPIASLIGRGSIAILIFSNVGIHELIVIAATLLLWVINLVVPALCGLVIVLQHRLQATT